MLCLEYCNNYLIAIDAKVTFSSKKTNIFKKHVIINERKLYDFLLKVISQKHVSFFKQKLKALIKSIKKSVFDHLKKKVNKV